MSETIDAYLATLPAGLESYPEACIKGGVVRSFAEDLRGRLTRSERLHPLAQRMIEEPPPPSAWVPDTHLHVLYLAALEVCFTGPGGEAAFEQWIYERTQDSLRSPLYRALFFVLSPERVLLGLPKRWSAFHRGTNLEALSVDKSTAILRFTSPPGLLPAAAFRALRAVVRAAGMAAGASAVRVHIQHDSPSEATLEVRWVH